MISFLAVSNDGLHHLNNVIEVCIWKVKLITRLENGCVFLFNFPPNRREVCCGSIYFPKPFLHQVSPTNV